ncbi:MAG: hypothetical protein H7Z41_03270 [Cytophagales bacterium]|nr:hypothetical protein [Armatimonadota bacterium]
MNGPESLGGPVLWQGEALYQIRMGETGSYRHRFGGPLDLVLEDFPGDQKPLHRVATLDLTDPRLGASIPQVRLLPLLYGFTFSGCALRYQILSDTAVRVLDLAPLRSSEDWPYRGYPEFFVPVPFDLEAGALTDLDKLDALTWQGLEGTASQDLIVIIPPSAEYGVSLWGEGDSELVEVMFQIDTKTGHVLAVNQCG